MENMLHNTLTLLVGCVALCLFILGGGWLMSRFRAFIRNPDTTGSEAVHSMMANLRRSLEQGEISSVEYRTIKNQLMSEIQDQINRNA